jgi:hypothetical protein
MVLSSFASFVFFDFNATTNVSIPFPLPSLHTLTYAVHCWHRRGTGRDLDVFYPRQRECKATADQNL